jgi:hypothetical protein
VIRTALVELATRGEMVPDNSESNYQGETRRSNPRQGGLLFADRIVHGPFHRDSVMSFY